MRDRPSKQGCSASMHLACTCFSAAIRCKLKKACVDNVQRDLKYKSLDLEMTTIIYSPV
jgi:hypothetical protein